MKRIVVIFLLWYNVIPISAFSQANQAYESAFLELKGMLTDSIPLNFKRAVFWTENAYLGDQLSYEAYDQSIRFLASLCTNIANQNPILYQESDKAEVNKYAAVYRLMMDTVRFTLSDTSSFVTKPSTYDFEDFWGERRWEKMFVTKLLETHSGNCHSLPFLYKILCEELGSKAYLAMAPNHLYVKQWTKKTGWFNTELTSHSFPIDAWIMASGYVHLSAVQNKIYMDALSQKQSIAVCLTDLAKGFERKFPDQLDFIERSADFALKYYPNYINARLLKAEITKKRFERLMEKGSEANPVFTVSSSKGQELFASMENQYMEVHKLGYRMMPKEMYVNWLGQLKREQSKFLNKSAATTLNPSK